MGNKPKYSMLGQNKKFWDDLSTLQRDRRRVYRQISQMQSNYQNHERRISNSPAISITRYAAQHAQSLAARNIRDLHVILSKIDRDISKYLNVFGKSIRLP
jgi:hypothetical protein